MLWIIVKRGPLESNDTQNSPDPKQAQSADASRERGLFLATLFLVVGLGLVGTVSTTIGGVVTLAAWGYFVFALHRYGRTGKA